MTTASRRLQKVEVASCSTITRLCFTGITAIEYSLQVQPAQGVQCIGHMTTPSHRQQKVEVASCSTIARLYFSGITARDYSLQVGGSQHRVFSAPGTGKLTGR